MTFPGPAFVIVGTPRSGTTLVQRLACELPGVRVPPETHFFSLFALGLTRRRRFPLRAEEIDEEVRAFASLETSRGMRVDVPALVEELGGRCDRPLDLFGAIVRQLVHDAPVAGEKTPDHLLWWRRLTDADPALKVVAVVRDPRAVVNSYRSMPFGMDSHVLLAERWRSDQRLVAAARARLGPARCLVVRYEDVVADPEAARRRLADILAVEAGFPVVAAGGGPELYRPWETWKKAVSEPVSTERVESWRRELTPPEIADVTAICRREMGLFGYPFDRDEARPRMRRATAAPTDRWRRLHFRASRRLRLARIARTVV